MELTARDLARLLELNKKKAEFEFKKRVFGVDDDGIKSVVANANDLSSKIDAAGIKLAIPNQIKLDDLGTALANFSSDDIRESLKIKDGKVYAVIHERGLIVKKNYENRLEIAKISIVIAKIKDGKQVFDAVVNGTILVPIALSSLDENEVKKLARFLRRCGLGCLAKGSTLEPSTESDEKEVRLQISNRNVWISESCKVQLEENVKKIAVINSVVQLRNAERQIKSFDDEEESKFASLQKEYLDLLKAQDELLKEFNEEERLSVKSGA